MGGDDLPTDPRRYHWMRQGSTPSLSAAFPFTIGGMATSQEIDGCGRDHERMPWQDTCCEECYTNVCWEWVP